MFGFYCKNDPEKEIIFQIDSSTKERAVHHFAFLKNLNPDDFRELYTVIEIK